MWARRVADAGSNPGEVHARAVATWPDRSSIIVGEFYGTATFGAGEPNETPLGNLGGADAFIARYREDGRLLWARQTESTGLAGAGALGVATFSDGSSVVVGTYRGLFVARYDTDGRVAWVRDAPARFLWVTGLGGFPDGSFVVAGYFTGDAVFGAGESEETTLSSGDAGSGFVARYDADGRLAWARSAVGGTAPAPVWPSDLCVFQDGMTAIVGQFDGSVTFGAGQPGETSFVGGGAFVARYRQDGSFAWARQLSGRPLPAADVIYVHGAGAFPDGSCVVTGFYWGRIAALGLADVPETHVSGLAGDPNLDLFVARFGADGSLSWARSSQGHAGASSWAYSAASLPDGSSVVSGPFMGTVTFGVGVELASASAGVEDLFIACYDPGGALRWARRAGHPAGRAYGGYGWGVAGLSDGSAVVTGNFLGSLTFGPGEPAPTTLTTSLATAFLARYAGSGAVVIRAADAVAAECLGGDGCGEIHVDAFVDGVLPASAVLTVTDVTGGRLLLEQPASSGPLHLGPFEFPLGSSTLRIDVTAAGAVLATASVSVQINDALPPVISGIGPKSIELQGPLTTLYRSALGISVTDNCDPDPVVTFTPAALPLGTTRVTILARDATGGASGNEFDVTVVDTTPPAFTVMPADLVAECTGGAAWVAFDVAATDLSGAVTLACTDETGRAVDHAGASFEDGVHTVTWVASDASGNEATWAFTITVRDTTAPVIVCPADITAPNEPGECFAYVAFAVTATDACDPSVPISTTAPWGPVASGDAFPVGLTEVTCSARDTSGNEATCSFRILVRDAEPPVITCPETAVVYTDATGSPRAIAPADLDATATDNCFGPIAFFCTPNIVSPGTTDIVLTARDGDGNESTCDVSVTVLRQGEVLTPAGSPVTVTPQAVLPSGSQAPVEITFDQVTGGGVTSVMTAPAGPPAPHGFKLGTPPVYYDVTTTVQFIGTIELCFSWVEGQIANERNVRLFHQEGGRWIDVTTSVDTTTNIICGRVSSLSPFIVAEIEYAFEGFLAPLNADGSSLFKAGRTVPLKFRIRGPSGEIVSDATARVRTWRVSSSVTGTVEEEIAADSAGASNEADLFRFDPDTGQYIFNLQTKGWSKGTYRAEARLDDGSVHGVAFSVRE